ncbi:DUF4142 domain-containing protein [Legionella sp. D16C41]|uniref:DUF4142 domain-containing protein n=1 Tax=Legionella sp. D16C41 TaxID=3402688 RepID=UPI003AF4B3A2
MMKLKLTTAVLLSTFSLSTVFAAASTTHNTNSNQSMMHTKQNSGAMNQSKANAAQQDGQILDVLVVLNQNEIAAANLISKKKDVNDSVKRYARMLAREHGKNLKETMKLSHSIGSPMQNATADSLKKKGEHELATLNPLTGAALDKAYIDAMVNDHQQALQLFDDNLMPNASNQKLKAQLTQTRKHLVKHLKEAQAIQNKLNQTANSDTDTSSSTGSNR